MPTPAFTGFTLCRGTQACSQAFSSPAVDVILIAKNVSHTILEARGIGLGRVAKRGVGAGRRGPRPTPRASNMACDTFFAITSTACEKARVTIEIKKQVERI